MNKNNPINSVYLLALACASMVLYVNSFYETLVYAVTIFGVFLFAISVVSMIEKIADKNVKFFAYALICAALITILKVVFQYVNISLIVIMSKSIDIAIVPCLLIGIVPIYFEDSLSVKQYFISAILMSVGVVLMLGVFGMITEILGYGSFLDKSLGFKGVEFFALPHGKFIVIALITVIINLFRRAYLKHVRHYRMIVDKYKIQIREIRSTEQRRIEAEGGKDNE